MSTCMFQNPTPPSHWHGTITTTSLPSACVQSREDFKYIREHAPFYDGSMDEDCLYLNIYVPVILSKKGLFPVLVHVHGGSNMAGMGAMFHGDVLASEGEMIVVTFNYRLAALGFLSIPDLDIAGNFGIFDQLQALRWVSENIANFGGDPGKVTLQGHSAGSTDVGLHLLSPLSQVYFQRAILQSGSPTVDWALMSRREETDAYSGPRSHLVALGCQDRVDGHRTLRCLREVDARTLAETRYNYTQGYHHFTPVIDGVMIVSNPVGSNLQDKVKAEAVMMGLVKDEGSLTAEVIMRSEHPTVNDTDDARPAQPLDIPYDEVLKMIVDFYPRLQFHTFAADLIQLLYKPWSDPDNITAKALALSEFCGDIVFNSATLQFADMLREVPQLDLFLYRFEHRSTLSIHPQWIGVPHGDDLFYLFGCPLDGHPVRSYTHLDRKVSLKLIETWSSFVHTGWPSKNKTTSQVQPFSPDESYFIIDNNGTDATITKGNHLRAQFHKFWNSFIPLLASPPPSPAGSDTVRLVLIVCVCLLLVFCVGLAVCFVYYRRLVKSSAVIAQTEAEANGVCKT
ncbi:acetylcholinesterase-like [Physella acuta]|uniref:acetylcholinesterase-like n=1 Tax=Physella acuta TaxID=109671 RepID=UPI0027DC9F2B|nr:acetylcholinesterase-like [Physella acuta]